MNKVLNFGSINVDHVYYVDRLARPGETISCRGYSHFAGGKGLNQSIALAQAGAQVYHAGKLGIADLWLKNLLKTKGVDTRWVKPIDGPSGHAIIQVDDKGENSIIIVAGANGLITEEDIHPVLSEFGPGDYLLLQNETSATADILRMAKARGMTVVLNPAPMSGAVKDYPLDCVNLLIVNETEGSDLTGKTEPEGMYHRLRQTCPNLALLVTLGSKGACYFSDRDRCYQPAHPVEAIDTTGAGDTAVGYFVAELIRTNDPHTALALACQAATLSVTRRGAADAIPTRTEVEAFLGAHS